MTFNPVSDNTTSLRDRLSSVAIDTLSEIMIDRAKRIEGYKNEQNLLNGGIWYGNEYYNILNKQLHYKRLQFLREKGAFYTCYSTSQYFKMKKSELSPIGFFPYLIVKDGCSPSNAIDDLQKSITFLGCAETCLIGYLKAIRSVIGFEKFDKFFTVSPQYPLVIDFNVSHPYFNLLNTIPVEETWRKGQIAYISNTKLYPQKHLNGEGSGHFCICCDDTSKKEKFLSLGFPIEGSTYDDINKKLIYEYNQEPIGMDIVTESVAKKILSTYPKNQNYVTDQLKKHTISFPEFFQTGGGMSKIKFDFNVKRILELRDSSLDNVKILFNKWNKL